MAFAEEIPADIAFMILRKLECAFDRKSFAAVCRPWRQAAGGPALSPPVPKLPLLLLPAANSPVFACILSPGSPHRLPVPIDARSARFFGSHDGGWVFVELPRRNNLLHLPSGLVMPVPDSFLLEVEGRDNTTLLARGMQAAVLSCSPEEKGCTAAAIVTGDASSVRYVSLWDVSGVWDVTLDSRASTIFTCPSATDLMLIDRGELLVLNKSGSLLRCTILRRPDGSLWDVDVFMAVRRADVVCSDHPVVARYLVRSRGETLMIERLAPAPGHATSSFKIFRMEEIPPAFSSWTKVPHLDGRILFIGRCCSRCYESKDLAGAGEGLYFLDDSSFCARGGRFSHSDNGKWSPAALQSDFFTVPEEMGSYTSPLWVIP